MKKENLSKIEKVRFSDFALDDLDEILNHIAEFDIEAGNKFIRELVKKFRLLAENPAIGTAKNELVINLRSFPYKRYNIFYFPTKNGIEIYRVLPASRNIIQVFDDVIDETE
ncbi:MAG: type II toxin-antitoxin system RelE/ParE family toxin [Pyrinomonadaceae bacterium]